MVQFCPLPEDSHPYRTIAEMPDKILDKPHKPPSDLLIFMRGLKRMTFVLMVLLVVWTVFCLLGSVEIYFLNKLHLSNAQTNWGACYYSGDYGWFGLLTICALGLGGWIIYCLGRD